MKKAVILSVLLFFVAIFSLSLVGCSKEYLEIYNQTIIFDKGSDFNLNDAEVKLIHGNGSQIIENINLEIETNYDKNKEGIYTVKLNFDDAETQYDVFVFDFNKLTLLCYESLKDINLPYYLSWQENENEIFEVAGVYNRNLIFTDSLNKKHIISVDIKVSEKQNVWTKSLNINNWVYGNEPSKVEGESLFGKVKFNYYYNENGQKGEQLESMPTEAGKYIVSGSVESSESYTFLYQEKTFEIYKAEIDVVIQSDIDLTKVYDETSEFFSYQDDLVYVTNLPLYVDNVEIIILNCEYVDLNTLKPNADVGFKKLKIQVSLSESDSKNFVFENGTNNIIIYKETEIFSLSPSLVSNPNYENAYIGNRLSCIELKDGIVEGKLYRDNSFDSYKIEGSWEFINKENYLKESGIYEIKFIPKDRNISSITSEIYIDGKININLSLNIDGINYFQNANEENEIQVYLPYNVEKFLIQYDMLENFNYKCEIYYDDLFVLTEIDKNILSFESNIFENYSEIIILLNISGQEDETFSIIIKPESLIDYYVNDIKQELDYEVSVGDKLSFSTKYFNHSLYLGGNLVTDSVIVGYENIGMSLPLDLYDENMNYIFGCFIKVKNAFEYLTINDEIYNDLSKYIFQYDYLDSVVNISFKNPTLRDIKFQYYTSLNSKPILLENFELKIDVANIEYIYFEAFINQENNSYINLSSWKIEFEKFSYIENIISEDTNFSYDKNKGEITLTNPQNPISVVLKNDAYTYRFEDVNGNIYDFSNLNLINDVYLIIIDESGNEIERKNLKIQFDLSLTIISDYYGELQLIQNQDGEFIINSNLNDRVAFNSELEIMILETNSNEFYINENYQEFNITIIYEFITITSKIYAYGSFMEINMYLPYIEYQEENYIDSICFELNGFAILKSYTNEIQNIIDSFNYINYGNSIVFDYELDSSYILVSVEIMDNFYAYGIILIQQI